MKKRSLLILLALTLVLASVLPLSVSFAATYYYVSGTSSVKIRQYPDSNARVLDSYRADYAVVSYKKYDANWAYVHFSNGMEGYVMRKYLKSSSTSTAYVSKDETPLRAGPANSFSQTATLSQGNKVKVLTSGATWSYISADAGTGYVRKSQLSSTAVKKSANSGTPYTAYVTNPSGRKVNVRQGAGKGYSANFQLEPGTQVTVEEIQGNWHRISSPVSGWIMNVYLTKKAPKTTTTTTETTTTTTTGKVRYITSPNGKGVNVRHGPSEKGYAVMATLDYGTQVNVLSSEKGWSKIRSGAVTGYVKNEYLSAKKPSASSSSSSSSSSSKPSFKSFSATIKSSDGKKVNLRTDAGLGYSTKAQIPSGTGVTVIGEKGNWYEVSYDGMTGFVKKEFVKK